MDFGVRLPVLMYHNVGPLRPGTVPGLTIGPETFAKQMRWLRSRGFEGISASDWLAWRCRQGPALPSKPVVLTFDDAYQDVVEHALPVLCQCCFKATVFVVTSCVGETNRWDEAKGWGTLRIMTGEQIQHWAANGIEFGAHTRTHPDLTSVDAPRLHDEVAGSREDLSALLGRPVVSFAYPYGASDERVRESVSSCYDMAFTTEEGLNTLQTDSLAMRRAWMSPEAWLADLELKVLLGRSPIQRSHAIVSHAIRRMAESYRA